MSSTNIYEFTDAKGIVVSGDIHGDFEKLVYMCCVQYQMTYTLIIVAGDCGFGFYRPDYYDAIYKKVSNRLAKANNWIVFIRGNHDNPAYFDGIGKNHTVDVVITHTAPSFCQEVQPSLIDNWLKSDKDLLDDLNHERKVMDAIHTYLIENGHPLQHWFMGHFHYSWNSEFEGVHYSILGIIELKELRL